MVYNTMRRKSRVVSIGRVKIGGHYPVAVQSMTNTDTRDVSATISQIRDLERAGCDVIRITVPDEECAKTILKIKESGIETPIVADIHFDYRIALKCAEYGVDKIRINPGNIGDEERVRAVCRACQSRHIPIRIGVNSGSVEKPLLEKYGGPTPDALVESALKHASLLEKNGFEDIVISIKASNVYDTVRANRILAEACDYPIHIGVTEAGTRERGLLKSTAGIASLLMDGIGDTVRVSLTADPVEEPGAARQIFQSIGLEGQCGLDLVCCPTCGRTKIDLIPLAEAFEKAVREKHLDRLPYKVAIMGCAVNGPGEAKEADFGIAGGVGEGLLFEKGKIISKIPEDRLLQTLLDCLTAHAEKDGLI